MMSRVKVTLTHVLLLRPSHSNCPLPEASMSEIWWLSRSSIPTNELWLRLRPNTLFGRLNSRMNNSNGNLSLSLSRSFESTAVKKVVALPAPPVVFS